MANRAGRQKPRGIVRRTYGTTGRVTKKNAQKAHAGQRRQPSSGEQAGREIIRQVSIDIGSSGTRIDYRLLGHSDRCRQLDFGMAVGEDRHEWPTKLGYDGQGRFICGRDLEQLVKREKMREDEVLHNVKLGFYEHEETREYREELERQLKRIFPKKSQVEAKQQLLEDYFKFLLQRTTAAMVSPEYSADFLESTELVVLITMPDMIDASANEPLVEAAMAAGANKARIANESVCTLTTLFVEDQGENMGAGARRIFEVGEIVAVADFGGGYGCMTVQEVLAPADPQQTPGLRLVQSAISSPCGSKMIDTAFQRLLAELPEVKQDYGDIETLAGRLGHSKATFLAKVTDEFINNIKIGFGSEAYYDEDQEYKVEVSRCRGPGWIENHWQAFLSHAQVKGLFDGVIKKAIEILKDCLKVGRRSRANPNRPTKLILTGGLTRNGYAREAFSSAVEALGIQVIVSGIEKTTNAVCRGALYRYENPNFSGLFQRLNLAVVRDEELNLDDHQDAILETYINEEQQSVTIWNEHLVRKDSHGYKDEDGQARHWAHERLNWIIRFNENDVNSLKPYESWAIDHPALRRQYIYNPELYYTLSDDIRDHEPLYKSDGKTHQDHLKELGNAPLVIKQPDKQGWDKVKHPDGTTTYEIAIGTKVFVSADGWSLKRVIRRKDEMPDWEELVNRRDTHVDWNERGEGDSRKVFDPSRSQIPLPGT